MADDLDPDQIFASVADFDQHHAQAIDWLREAQTFMLAVPRQDEETGEWRIVVSGGGIDFDKFLPAVAASLTLIPDDISQRVEDSLRRSRQARYLMLGCAALNLALVALSLSRFVW